MHDQIAATGAPELLLDRYDGRLEYHAPFHQGARSRTCSAGSWTPARRTSCSPPRGTRALRLVDNGEIGPERTRST